MHGDDVGLRMQDKTRSTGFLCTEGPRLPLTPAQEESTAGPEFVRAGTFARFVYTQKFSSSLMSLRHRAS